MLQVFDRRSEIPTSVQLAFVADQDTWINSVIPAAYVESTFCLTSGYSIENDVIEDGNLEALLVGSEGASYRADLSDFLDWYALALSRHLADLKNPIALHPQYVLDPTQRPTLLALHPGEFFPSATRASLLENYNKLVRGKSLLALLIRNTNTRPGQPKHSDKALLEIVAARPGPLLTRLTRAIEAILVT